jgi:hypothetical protein
VGLLLVVLLVGLRRADCTAASAKVEHWRLLTAARPRSHGAPNASWAPNPGHCTQERITAARPPKGQSPCAACWGYSTPVVVRRLHRGWLAVRQLSGAGCAGQRVSRFVGVSAAAGGSTADATATATINFALTRLSLLKHNPQWARSGGDTQTDSGRVQGSVELGHCLCG